MNIWTMITPWVGQAFRDIIRSVVGPWLTAHGVLNGSNEQAGLGAIITLGGIVWGWWVTSGSEEVGKLLQKMTAQHSHADAVEVAKVLPAPPPGVVNAAVVAAVAKVLLIAFAILLFLPMGAYAQIKLKPPAEVKHDIDSALGINSGSSTSTSVQTERQKMGCDLLNLKPGCKTAKVADDFKSLDDAMSDPMKAFVAFVQGDTSTALKLSSSVEGLHDGNGQACLLQLQKSGAIINTLQDTVKGGGTIGIATIYEALRLLHMNLIQTCNNKACTQIFSETTNVAVAAAPIATQLPSVTQFCAKIPSIAVEPTTTIAAVPVPASPQTLQ